jgi:hypothetical protein
MRQSRGAAVDAVDHGGLSSLVDHGRGAWARADGRVCAPQQWGGHRPSPLRAPATEQAACTIFVTPNYYYDAY